VAGESETIVIPGHGEVTNRAALTKQIEYFDRLREIVTQAIQDGRTREEVTAMRPEAFRDYGFDFIRPIAFGGMYDELMALRQN
jgi:cyclase